MSKENLITPKFLSKLETLQMLSRKILTGTMKGERKSSKRGKSVEFADHRNYVYGDEIKTIDWNIYGRLDKLFVKLFSEEEELTFYILVDRSLSMDFGNPSKMEVAGKIAAALSYIALYNYDRVSVGIFDSLLEGFQPPVRGKQQIFTIFDLLKKLEPRGQTSLSKAIHHFCSRKFRPGMVIIISDFLDYSDFSRALRMLSFNKNDLFLIQVLDGFELNPEIGGDIKFVDVESGEVKELTVTDQLLDLYKNTIDEYCSNLRSLANKMGAGYIMAPTTVPFEDLVLQYLRKGALIK
ncbi:MAG: DUF58 domain-containing protein [Vulcanimicrobiota bacterium]